ncbi:MAG TPA: hypothetical protein VHE13_11270, partial [Opitutus sp.]|nr:hypothetical protein [Opitutus sp.]
LRSQLSGDLDWIVMKALEKNRMRRYESASAFAADLQRHLHNEPVTARPPSAAYLLEKLIRRHRVACVTGAVILVSLVAGLGISVWAYFNEKAARQYAVDTNLNLKKASDFNRTIMVRAADSKRRADASDKQAAIDRAKSSYAMDAMNALTAPTAGHLSPGPALDPVVTRMQADSSIPPEAKWELGESFGDLYFKLGDYSRAEALFRAAVTLRRKTTEDGNPAIMSVLRKLVETLNREGKEAEARRLLLEATRAESAFLQSGGWIKQLKQQAQQLAADGQFAEAEGKLLEAAAIAKNHPPDRYNPLNDLGLLAWLRYDAGDLAGARQLAQHWLDAERTARRWKEVGPFGFLSRTEFENFIAPYDACTLLGLIALHDGDRAAARSYLFRSAGSMTRWTTLEGRKLELATALAAAGDTDAASRFLKRLRPVYVDDYKARNFENTMLGAPQSQYYTAATGEAHARTINGWQLELSGGRVPTDWEQADVTPLSVPNRGPALPPVSALPLPPAQSEARRLFPLFPFAFLALGWCATAAAPRWRARELLPRRAQGWLLAFCALRTLAVVLFVAPIVGGGFTMPIFTEFFVTFFSWMAFWLFLRAFLPEACSRRESRFMSAVIGFGLVDTFLALIVGYTSEFPAILIACFVGTMVLLLVTVAAAFGVTIAGAKRIWKWQRTADLTPRQRLALKLAAPLLVVHAWISILAGSVHDDWPDFCVVIYAALAALPWLLAYGFYAGPRSAQAVSLSARSTP